MSEWCVRRLNLETQFLAFPVEDIRFTIPLVVSRKIEFSSIFLIAWTVDTNPLAKVRSYKFTRLDKFPKLMKRSREDER